MELTRRTLEDELFGPDTGEITDTFVKYLESSTSAPTPQLNLSPRGNDFEKSTLSSLSEFADDGLTPGTLQHQFYSAYLKKNNLTPTEHLEMKNKYLELTSLTSNYRKLEQKHNSWVKKFETIETTGRKVIDQNILAIENIGKSMHNHVESVKSLKASSEKLISKQTDNLRKMTTKHEKLINDLENFQKQYNANKPITGCAHCQIHCMHITTKDYRGPSGRPAIGSDPPAKKMKKTL